MSNVVIICSLCCFFSFVGLPPHPHPLLSQCRPHILQHRQTSSTPLPLRLCPSRPTPHNSSNRNSISCPHPPIQVTIRLPHPLLSPRHRPVSMYPHRAGRIPFNSTPGGRGSVQPGERGVVQQLPDLSISTTPSPTRPERRSAERL